jgi:hypothetical protein
MFTRRAPAGARLLSRVRGEMSGIVIEVYADVADPFTLVGLKVIRRATRRAGPR